MNFLKKPKGFSLIEIIVYTALLAAIILGIYSFANWSIRSYAKAKAQRAVLANARRAMAVIGKEVREANRIYLSTTSSSQLSLETEKYLAMGEETAYLDFFLCDWRLCQKKEHQDPSALTSEEVQITDFSIQAVEEGEGSVQVSITAVYNNPNNRPEYEASVSIVSAFSPRPQ